MKSTLQREKREFFFIPLSVFILLLNFFTGKKCKNFPNKDDRDFIEISHERSLSYKMHEYFYTMKLQLMSPKQNGIYLTE